MQSFFFKVRGQFYSSNNVTLVYSLTTQSCHDFMVVCFINAINKSWPYDVVFNQQKKRPNVKTTRNEDWVSPIWIWRVVSWFKIHMETTLDEGGWVSGRTWNVRGHFSRQITVRLSFGVANSNLLALMSVNTSRLSTSPTCTFDWKRVLMRTGKLNRLANEEWSSVHCGDDRGRTANSVENGRVVNDKCCFWGSINANSRTNLGEQQRKMREAE